MATPTTNSVPTSSIDGSGYYFIDALLGGAKWGGGIGAGVVIDFSFPDYQSYWSTSYADYGPTYGDGEPWRLYYGGLSSADQVAVREALLQWAAVANLTFFEVVDNANTVGELRFAWTNAYDEQAHAYFPGWTARSGDVWLNTNASWDGNTAGTFGFMTVMHEIGHALGLKHSFDNGVVLPSDEDSYDFTIMSYSAFPGVSGSWVNFTPTTPMLYDIAAIQYLYGANYSYHAGDDIYVYSEGNNYYETLWDGGGQDTIRWDATSQGATIDLRSGHWSDLGNTLSYYRPDSSLIGTYDTTVAIYYTVTIENAIGGDGDDVLIGNEVANVLQGRGGADTLTGGADADVFHDTPAGLHGDHLTDFSPADTIEVVGAYFGNAQVSYDWDLPSVFLDTNGNIVTDTVIHLPNGLVGGFSANPMVGGTRLDFDAWSLKTWGGDLSDKPIVGNFDGSGGDEYGVYRVATAEWFLYGQPAYVWGGGPHDIPVVGDYNGDGRDDFGVYRVDTAQWWIVGQPLYVWGGGPYDTPVVGDFNGDGVDDFGVYRVNTAEWWIVGQPKYVWGGGPNDVPVVGDYNGDGIDDFGVYRKDTAEWWIAGQPKYVWGGGANDTPVVGDFNGDGRDDFGVYRSVTGEWLIANQLPRFIGGVTTAPVAADYDGDGVTDHAVFDDGIWLIDPSSDVLI